MCNITGDQAESLKVAPTHTRNKSSDLGDESVIHKTNHVDMEFQDGSTKFHCKVGVACLSLVPYHCLVSRIDI